MSILRAESEGGRGWKRHRGMSLRLRTQREAVLHSVRPKSEAAVVWNKDSCDERNSACLYWFLCDTSPLHTRQHGIVRTLEMPLSTKITRNTPVLRWVISWERSIETYVPTEGVSSRSLCWECIDHSHFSPQASKTLGQAVWNTFKQVSEFSLVSQCAFKANHLLIINDSIRPCTTSWYKNKRYKILHKVFMSHNGSKKRWNVAKHKHC